MQAFLNSEGQYSLAVGLNSTGEVYILDAQSLTRQLKICDSQIRSIDDLIIQSASENSVNSVNMTTSKDLNYIKLHNLAILSNDSLFRIKISE